MVCMKKLFKKLTAVVAAATMVMAMGVTAFASGSTLDDGEYTAAAHLYKQEACTDLSMGDQGMDGMDIVIEGDTATITLHTKQITYLGLTGTLKSMTLYDNDDNEYVATKSGYDFTVTDFPADQITENAVFKGSFTANVSIMPINMTGYLQITDITGM